MSKKITAGRDLLGNIAPKFAQLNDDFCLGKFGQERISCRLEIGV